MKFTNNLQDSFNIKSFKIKFFLTWFFIFLGISLAVILINIGSSFSNKKNIFYLFQNTGLFLVFVSFITSMGSIHISNLKKNREKLTPFVLFKISLKKIATFIVISLIILLFLAATLGIEILFSYSGKIKFAGPVIISLSTIPILFYNLFCSLILICLSVIYPLFAVETDNIYRAFKNTLLFLKKNWIHTLIYLMISFTVLYLCIEIVFKLLMYCSGIAQAVSWNIKIGFPKIVTLFSSKSIFSTFVQQMVPSPDPLSTYKEFGTKSLKYLPFFKHFMRMCYIFFISFILAFPLTVFFNLTSVVYDKLKDEN